MSRSWLIAPQQERRYETPLALRRAVKPLIKARAEMAVEHFIKYLPPTSIMEDSMSRMADSSFIDGIPLPAVNAEIIVNGEVLETAGRSDTDLAKVKN